MAYTDIDKSDDYFNTVTWTGDGSASRNITGINFQPDWVWVKCRNSAVSHAVYDSVRGASNLINTNSTSAEGTNPAVNAFISDGFTVNSDSYVNLNSNTYVAWNWLASNTTASNTNGSITSTVSANTTSGFSIVSYTGTGSPTTVGHGLGVKPDVIITKSRSGVEEWRPYFSVLGATKGMRLNGTNAEDTDLAYWNNTEPTSSVFTVGTTGGTNGNGITMIAYCFANVKGFSKFGSYTGNGNADGTFVYTGFKPAFVLAKQSSASGNDWTIYDNKRNNYNVVNKVLYPNASGTEATASNTYDFLSNGFKLRTTDARENASGSTYIYMAFAENPFVTSTGIPACAR